METNTQYVKDQLEKFMRMLNAEPLETDLITDNRYKLERTDKKTGQKSYIQPRYLPISYVQTKLDEIFYGLWETKIDHVQVVANEIIGHGTLTVTHPVTGQKLQRTGAAAVMVLMKSKDNGGTGEILNAENKIKNTLGKDYPHLLAEITKSAAKTLGKVFGRDTNREHTDTYTPFSIESDASEQIRQELRELIEGGTLPSTVHTFISGNLDTANFNQLCVMKGKADAEINKQLDAAQKQIEDANGKN